MNFSFGAPGGPPGGGASFLTPTATTTNNNTQPQGGGAAKLTRFDTATAATGAAGSLFSAGAGTSTLAGLLSAPQATTAPSLLSQLGVAATTTSLTLFPSTAATTATTGFGSAFGAQLSLPASSGFGFGTSTAATQPATSVTSFTFNTATGTVPHSGLGPALTTTTQGLGGVDTSAAGVGGTAGACTSTGSSAVGGSKTSCDAKAVKETELPPELKSTVDEFIKHVKAQKGVREEIARMSAKPLYLVEEDVKNLRQQLLIVSNSLYRYTSSIEKLKAESSRELRHAEIAQRTRDTPPGLQFENTAPSEYFDRLVTEFETAMVTYRAQIADTEAHFSSVGRVGLNGGGVAPPLTPQELSALFDKLNEGFMGLAARLHVVHEAVRAQREAYINYRKAFHGDYQAADQFENLRKCQATAAQRQTPTTSGLLPFSSVSSNTAATAMVSALGRTLVSAAGSSMGTFGHVAYTGGLSSNAATRFSGSAASPTNQSGAGLSSPKTNQAKVSFNLGRLLG